MLEQIKQNEKYFTKKNFTIEKDNTVVYTNQSCTYRYSSIFSNKKFNSCIICYKLDDEILSFISFFTKITNLVMIYDITFDGVMDTFEKEKLMRLVFSGVQNEVFQNRTITFIPYKVDCSFVVNLIMRHPKIMNTIYLDIQDPTFPFENKKICETNTKILLVNKDPLLGKKGNAFIEKYSSVFDRIDYAYMNNAKEKIKEKISDWFFVDRKIERKVRIRKTKKEKLGLQWQENDKNGENIVMVDPIAPLSID